MSQLNFPTSPTTGELYSIGANTWQWNGNAWIKYNNPNSTVSILTVTNSLIISTSTSAINTSSGALVVGGGVGISGDVWVGGRVNTDSLRLTDAIIDSTLVTINNTGTTLIDSYATADYRAAKYLIQIDSGVGSSATFQVSEITLLVSNTGTVKAVEYSVLTTEGVLGSFTSEVTIYNMVNLYFTTTVPTNKVVAVLRTAIAT